MTTENITLGADLRGGEAPEEKSGHISQATLAMLLFLGSEAMLFASFFTAYFMIRFNVADNVWPPVDPATGHPYVLPIAVTAVNTLFLVTSSFTLWWGEYRLQHGGSRKSVERGLQVTILLGLTFLVVQLNEYAHLGFTPQTNAFGSTFYTLTGLHALHVIVGLTLLTICYVRSRRRHEFTAERATHALGDLAVLALRRHRLGDPVLPGVPPMTEGRQMGRVRRGLLGVALIGAGVLAVAGCGSSGTNADDLAAGKQKFTELCGGCHMLAEAGTTGQVGPNLDDAFGAARADGFKPNGMKQLVEQWISEAQPPMPRNLVSGQDAANIAAYIASVAGTMPASQARLSPPPDPQARPVKFRT